LVPVDDYCQHAVQSRENQTPTKVITNDMQSNGWPSKFWAFCKVQLAINSNGKGLHMNRKTE